MLAAAARAGLATVRADDQVPRKRCIPNLCTKNRCTSTDCPGGQSRERRTRVSWYRTRGRPLMRGRARSRRHIGAAAVVYVRQSTLAQVRDHTESTMRQYALGEEAVRLGWASEASRSSMRSGGLGRSTTAGRVQGPDCAGVSGEIGRCSGWRSPGWPFVGGSVPIAGVGPPERHLVIDADGIYDWPTSTTAPAGVEGHHVGG